MTEDEYNDKYNETVIKSHSDFINQMFGEDVDINFGAWSDAGLISSKIYGHGCFVTTRYDEETLEVISTVIE